MSDRRPSDSPDSGDSSDPPKWVWGNERSRNGGIDELPLPQGPGRLLLCGKHYVGPDVRHVRAAHHVDVIVCLTQRHEIDLRYSGYTAWLDASEGSDALWRPVPDLGVLSHSEMLRLIEEVDGLLQAGKTILLHCAAGIGRTGTVAVAVLMRQGMTADHARAHVAAHRSLAGPETGPQHAFIEQLAKSTSQDP
jgi:hypothetical protein